MGSVSPSCLTEEKRHETPDLSEELEPVLGKIVDPRVLQTVQEELEDHHLKRQREVEGDKSHESSSYVPLMLLSPLPETLLLRSCFSAVLSSAVETAAGRISRGGD